MKMIMRMKTKLRLTRGRVIDSGAITLLPANTSPEIPAAFLTGAPDRMPHCDSSILHAPGYCEYCDDHPDWQHYRELARINFTGQRDESKAPCPSTHFRPDSQRDLWPGNRAIDNEGSFR